MLSVPCTVSILAVDVPVGDEQFRSPVLIEIVQYRAEPQIVVGNPANSCRSRNIVQAAFSKVLIERGSSKVQQELIDLARNQAATMGANAIVPSGEPVDGSQKFRAYLCN